MIPGNRVLCPSCREVVFESDIPLRLKGITFERLFDGRRRWYSRNYQMVVHECGVDLAAAMEITVTDLGESA